MWPIPLFIALAYVLFYFFGLPGALLGLFIIAVLLAAFIATIAEAIRDEIKLWRNR